MWFFVYLNHTKKTNKAPDGGLGERQKGTGKEQGGEARLTEYVTGDLNKESLCALLRQGIFLFVPAISKWVVLC